MLGIGMLPLLAQAHHEGGMRADYSVATVLGLIAVAAAWRLLRHQYTQPESHASHGG